MLHENCGFGTKAIHAGNVKDSQYGALTTPIFQTSTFVFDSCEQGGRRFAGAESGYIYTRLGNPTTSILEAKIAALENGEACVAAASGMGAISSALWSVAAAGKHIVADGTLYGCTFALLNHGMTRYGVEVQGATNIALTKLDILSYMDKIPVCAHYELDGQQTDEFPFPVCLQDAKPVIEYVDGWKCDISKVRSWDELPENARNYVEYVERAIGCHIGYVSVGAERDSLIIR